MAKPVSETFRQADTLSITTLSLVNQLYFPNIVSKQLPFSIYLRRKNPRINIIRGFLLVKCLDRPPAIAVTYC